MQKQNAYVLRTLGDTCKFKPEQMDEVSRIISEGHIEVIRKMDNFLGDEFDRVEAEIKEIQMLLIKKLAERRELAELIKTTGRHEGYQIHVRSYLDEKGGENSEKQSS